MERRSSVLLAGLIFCAKCGKRIGRTVSNRGVPRFRCVNHRNCHTASYDYAKTEEQVISALRQWVKGYTVEIENVGFESEADSCRDRIGQLTAELEKLNAQLDNAFDLVEQGLYTKEEFRRRKEKITGSQKAIQSRLDSLYERMPVREEQTVLAGHTQRTGDKCLRSFAMPPRPASHR